ncbi:DUF4232 domain-containing protein [Streptomyces racemochromogenes]|uniref:DUF4232 domain-containing protein n=1 Tax=Streptomyces racemochromogenes TaxID=67353 RepID=A0ABW7PKN2_9ACTN
MHLHRSRSTALAALVGLALTLTACGGSGSAGGAQEPPAPRRGAAASDAAPTATPTPTPTAAPSGTAAPASGASAAPDAKGTEDDAYAYTHPCSARNLTVKVTAPQGLPATVRVITVTNNASTACGLDFHPAVGFSAKGSTLGVQATAPDGLGGAPAHPVRPGATAYAAVDLNPAGGSGPVADEIHVLADPSHMPNADSTSLPLATPGTVARPKVGLYHFSARASFDTLR